MPLLLHIKRVGDTVYDHVDIGRNPLPAVMAFGVGGVGPHQYFLSGEGNEMDDVTAKPAYRIPTMDEVRAIPWNGLSVASLFAGCGGSSLGYRMAGFRVFWASEFVDAARDCYAANKADYTTLDGRDIRLVSPNEIIRDLMSKGLTELDVLDGSPPCASFSTAGKRQAHWGQERKYSDKTQRTDDLFHEYVRILRGLRPKVFVAENVSGLVKGVAKGYFLEILKALKESGYRVEARVLDAQWLGVPQQRQRVIFVGVREDLAADPAFPDPLRHRYSVRDAIPWIGRVKEDAHGFFPGHDFDAGNRPFPTVRMAVKQDVVDSNHFQITHDGIGRGTHPVSADDPLPTVRAGSASRSRTDQFTVETQVVAVGVNGAFGEEAWKSPDEPAGTIGATPNSGNGRVGAGDLLVVEKEADISRFAIGDEADKLLPGQQSDKYFQLVRAPLDGPSPTVSAAGGGSATFAQKATAASVIHPTEKRKFSIAELKRICSFPDSFIVTGTYAQQWERMGRAVPPLMMRAIAETIRDRILLPLRDRG